MDYEHKYKEALERARIEYKNEQSKGNIWVCEKLSTIFPELRESEDERIRKELIQYFEKVELNYMNREEILAWLEKQDEKKPSKE